MLIFLIHISKLYTNNETTKKMLSCNINVIFYLCDASNPMRIPLACNNYNDTADNRF